MSRRIVQINKNIQRILGEILQREADLPVDALVTISRVDTTPNLASATVWLYVFPVERSEEILERLTRQLYDIQGALNRALDQRPLPRIRLRVDYGAEHAENIEKTFRNLTEE